MVNIWIEKESREHCHVNYVDYSPELGLTAVLVVYFGGEEGSYNEMYPVEAFFEMHEPERFHS